jgi:PAT family beta-lactamase induction signal transducer AmpG
MSAEATKRSWAEAIGVYLRPSVLRMLFFGFSAGLPFLLVFTTLTAWLRDYDISKSAIGFFAWIGTTYSIKVLWAPVVDRVPLPLLTKRLGQRRSWMILAQVGIAAGLAAMALTDPSGSLTAIALLALFVAFCSATQDITVDAFRIESDVDEYQAALASTYVIGYRLAILVAGAGALYIADFWSWTAAYLTMAACMSVGMLAVLLSREPSSADRLDIESDPLVQSFRKSTSTRGWRQEAGAWIVGSIVAPFKDFVRRVGWLAFPVLALIGLYKISDLSMAAMANPLYIDLGFSLSEIASVTKVFGIVMTLTGGVIGGIVVARYGILPMMLAGALLVAVTNLVFAWLATVGYSLPALFATIGADNFATGFSATVFIAFLSSLVSRRYTATQYALFSSFMTLPGKIIGGPSGVIVDNAGYVAFFFYASALGIPAILLILWLMRRRALDHVRAE